MDDVYSELKQLADGLDLEVTVSTIAGGDLERLELTQDKGTRAAKQERKSKAKQSKKASSSSRTRIQARGVFTVRLGTSPSPSSSCG